MSRDAIIRRHEALVRFLCDPASYPDAPGRVETIETHISHIFLTDRHAYKLKKPVRFDFLDFSAPRARFEACQQEVALNRRLAGDVYLDVVPIVQRPNESFALGAPGEAVDWVVKMRRLDATRSLDQLLHADAIGTEQLKSVSRLLANFYEKASALPITGDPYRSRLESHVRSNRQSLLAFDLDLSPAVVKRVHARQLQLLKLAPQFFEERVTLGRIVDGHGDLRPEHIYLDSDPVVIDCLEFSKELRTVDVADDLAFLAMELERLGFSAWGTRLVAQVERELGDCCAPQLWAFYTSYRAAVRAKVSLLRSDQQPADRGSLQKLAGKYLNLADRWAAQIGRPLCLVIRGLSGAGKSTLAAAVAAELGAKRLSTDEIRRDLFPSPERASGYGDGIYSLENRERVYGVMLDRAQTLLGDGQSVVLDGAFLQTRRRQEVAQMARCLGASSILVRCQCPVEFAAARASRRSAQGGALSDANQSTVLAQVVEDEPDSPEMTSIDVDTTRPLTQQLEELFRGAASVMER